jgi:hypothetical protein
MDFNIGFSYTYCTMLGVYLISSEPQLYTLREITFVNLLLPACIQSQNVLRSNTSQA